VSLFSAPVFLAWWPMQHQPMPEGSPALDAAPFLAFSNAMAEAEKYTRRGRTVRILVPEGADVQIPSGRWDMTGVVIVPLALGGEP